MILHDLLFLKDFSISKGLTTLAHSLKIINKYFETLLNYRSKIHSGEFSGKIKFWFICCAERSKNSDLDRC